MKKILRLLDRIFNGFFTSKFNPLYCSGTIAVGLLVIALISGLILCFFYRIGEPYESVSAMQKDPWLGSWIRSTHRYASDAMVAVVLVHILRMFAQGKSWGPRALAWTSGVLLLLFLFISGWTGFVLVWDTQGLAVAAGGAKIMDALGIFSDSIARSFDGSASPPASFFFFNLFMHIVIPLAMIFGLWLHTCKMANAIWLPGRSLMTGMTAAIVITALIFPAPISEKADLLSLPEIIPLDWLYNFWLPWTARHPVATFMTLAGAVTLLFTMPWWTKPKPELRPIKSSNDPKRCQGCTQCVQDCPYEAISMVPRMKGLGSALVAQVDPQLCVGCGLCAASCAPFTMGPPGRKGGDQFSESRSFLNSLRGTGVDPKEQILVLSCSRQTDVDKNLEDFVSIRSGFQFYRVACAGTVHAVVLEHFAKNFREVAVVACPERNCTNKDGHRLLSDRLSGVREPTLEHDVHRQKIRSFSVGDGEESELIAHLKAMQRGEQLKSHTGHYRRFLAGISATVLVFGLAAMARWTAATGATDSLLRLSIRLSGQSEKTCRTRTTEELSALPQHMRTAEVCDSKALTYRLSIQIDGRTALDELTRPGGLHSDRPIYVERDLVIAAGKHRVEMTFAPTENHEGKAIALALKKDLQVARGRIVLLHLSQDQKSILVKGDEG